jgi:hypothetical protein
MAARAMIDAFGDRAPASSRSTNAMPTNRATIETNVWAIMATRSGSADSGAKATVENGV